MFHLYHTAPWNVTVEKGLVLPYINSSCFPHTTWSLIVKFKLLNAIAGFLCLIKISLQFRNVNSKVSSLMIYLFDPARCVVREFSTFSSLYCTSITKQYWGTWSFVNSSIFSNLLTSFWVSCYYLMQSSFLVFHFIASLFSISTYQACFASVTKQYRCTWKLVISLIVPLPFLQLMFDFFLSFSHIIFNSHLSILMLVLFSGYRLWFFFSVVSMIYILVLWSLEKYHISLYTLVLKFFATIPS